MKNKLFRTLSSVLPAVLIFAIGNLGQTPKTGGSGGPVTPSVITNPYILNQTTVQPNSNFNISGTGIANVFDAGTQFNIAGNRILSNAGAQNLFAGLGAGLSNTNGVRNSFFGFWAGSLSAYSSDNSFFGNQAGAGTVNSNYNSFFGSYAGLSNTSGSSNSFLGFASGEGTTNGSSNTFIGVLAGEFNDSGNFNVFVGSGAGRNNLRGSYNTSLGTNALIGEAYTNATAIGANAVANQDNSLVLGSINGKNGATADTNVGIGTVNPASRLHVNGSVRVTNGSIFVSNPNTLVITSPNGACWGLTVSNTGAVSAFSTPCP